MRASCPSNSSSSACSASAAGSSSSASSKSRSSVAARANAADDSDSELVGGSTSEEEDDTAEDENAAGAIGGAQPPPGYEEDYTALPNENDLIGRKLLFKWDGAPVAARDFGCFFGIVKRRLSANDESKFVGCSFWVTFRNSDTSGVIPSCSGLIGKTAQAEYALGITQSTRGAEKKWILLNKGLSSS